ncbi:MAG: HlyC/CorC family transporter [Planctomycetes bacterium]|nr:HlyC/CorC family transporter [Planctomycetota bacterium]
MILQWILLVLLLACSGFISSAETALFGLSRLELRSFTAGGGPLKRRAVRLMRHPQRVLMTVLMANTTVNVLFFAVAFVTFERLGDTHALAATVAGVVTLLAVIVFGEVLPKALARAHAARFAPLVVPPIQALQTVLTPFRWFLGAVLVVPLTRLLQAPSIRGDEVTVDELRALVEMSAHRGVIDSAENRMLQTIVALPEINVRSVMKPRVDVRAVPIGAPPGRVRREMQRAKLTKLPVYGRDLDDIRGLVYARDLHLRAGVPVARLIRPVPFVPEQINLLRLIEHFRSTQSQLAIVVDEYGGMAGLITLEDVLEEMVGDLAGTDKPAEPDTEMIDQDTYRLAGDLSIREWIQQFGPGGLGGTLAASARVQTIAGLVLAELGRWPRVGDSVRIRNLTLTVERIEGRRIARILLHRDRAGSTPSAAGEPGKPTDEASA